MSKILTLENLGGGAALERFQLELEKVLENINDPNTKAKAMREVTLKLKITPDEERYAGKTELQITSKLAPLRSHDSIIYMGIENGKHVAAEHDYNQGKLFDQEERPEVDSEKVTSIEEGRKTSHHD